MRWRPAVAAALVAALAGSACGAEREPDATDGGCSTFLERRPDLRGPRIDDLAPLDRDVLAARLERERAVYESIEGVIFDDLADSLDFVIEGRRQWDDMLLDEWGDDGLSLVRSADATNRLAAYFVAVGGVEVDGNAVSPDAIAAESTFVREELSYRCEPEPTGWLSLDELPTATVPDDIRWLAVARDGRLVAGGADGSVNEVPLPAPWTAARNPVVSGDGTWLATRVLNETGASVLTHRLDEPMGGGMLVDAPGLGCLSFSPEGRSLVVTNKVGRSGWIGREHDLAAVEAGGAEIATGLQCVVRDSTGRVLGHRPSAVGGAEVVEQSADGRATALSDFGGCSTVYPRPRPGTGDVAVITRCDTVHDSGLWIVPRDGGDPVHVLNGVIGAPVWAPDGAWLMYGYTAHGDEWPTLWASPADGSSAVQLWAGEASWPAWIPADTSCAICD